MPLPQLLKTAVRITAKGHQIKSRLLNPYLVTKGDAKLYILKVDGITKPFKVLAVVTPFIIGESDTFRDRTRIEIATTAQTFGTENNQTLGDILAIATHVAAYPELGVYWIREGDELMVRQQDFVFKIDGLQVADSFNPADYS